MSVTKVIMGVDPGTNLLGYAFVQSGGKKPRVLQMGVLDMRKAGEHLDKMKQIYDELERLIGLFEPVEMAIEAPFFHKNVQAMLKLGRAQGMAIAAAFSKGVPVTEYLPKVVKKAITGNGNASKEQLALMLPHLVQGEITAPFQDATDALGVAVCHVFQTESVGTGGKHYSSWEGFIKENPGKKL